MSRAKVIRIGIMMAGILMPASLVAAEPAPITRPRLTQPLPVTDPSPSASPSASPVPSPSLSPTPTAVPPSPTPAVTPAPTTRPAAPGQVLGETVTPTPAPAKPEPTATPSTISTTQPDPLSFLTRPARPGSLYVARGLTPVMAGVLYWTAGLLMLAGVAVLLWPVVTTHWRGWRQWLRPQIKAAKVRP